MQPIKKYNCLIIDDEPPAREVLRRYISQVPMLSLIGECGNAVQAISMLKQHHIDLLFLDIQMPQVTGLDLIGTLVNPPKIVLTTAFEQYAVRAFELDVTDYLVKPIRFDRFLKAVMKALPEQDASYDDQTPFNAQDSTDHAFLYFRADRKMVKVMLNDILYIESLKDYVKINTTKGPVITKYAITSLEAMLPASFIRVHRSYLIALDKIDSYTQDEINIGIDVIPIGKLYRMQVLNILAQGNG
ncbi:LytR/AlgR family response regulator transcription factor [Mucilaginibacter myungsuensis]|uniref:Response regulator n=1 Tax=Mucilaginibacter myungsuensis TaxID=649104 RepID=A0A929KYK7_9SPHI|nr:response regulator [Mucilaginibacter myungsuensis]MBE9663032.1 response regulator [Mucilaginibacter myungsuensis]MDN3598663.1 response regulator [Mucilaginibacter myungsuensis]